MTDTLTVGEDVPTARGLATRIVSRTWWLPITATLLLAPVAFAENTTHVSWPMRLAMAIGAVAIVTRAGVRTQMVVDRAGLLEPSRRRFVRPLTIALAGVASLLYGAPQALPYFGWMVALATPALVATALDGSGFTRFVLRAVIGFMAFWIGIFVGTGVGFVGVGMAAAVTQPFVTLSEMTVVTAVALPASLAGYAVVIVLTLGPTAVKRPAQAPRPDPS